MENKARQSGLDGLRGLAALTVFAIHIWIYQLPNTVKLRREGLGELALFEGRVAFVMFFVLSGYLLYRPFARAALGQGRPVSVGAYLLLLAALVGGGIAWNVADYAAGWGPVAAHSAPSFLPYFACGMLVALLIERQRALGTKGLSERASLLLGAGALVVLFLNGYWHAS